MDRCGIPEGYLIRERLFANSRLEDFTGVIFQHEFDHLKGILYTDKLVMNQ
jgi:peptide deformylase